MTLNLCSNASGTIKLPLHLIGKAKRPRCFRNMDMKLLPVKYTNQKNAWMTTDQFIEWFHNDFVPYVRKELESIGKEPTAVLVLDNCSAHPDSDDLTSTDGKIFAKFLPPNVTSLIQPMDQGVIESVKRRYKLKLLRKLVIEDECGVSVVDFLKGINLKIVADLVYESWSETSSSTLRKSWQKILPMSTSSPPVAPSPPLKELYAMAVPDEEVVSPESPDKNETHRGYGVWQGVKIRIVHSDDSPTDVVSDIDDELSFQSLFKELSVNIESAKIMEWLNSDANDKGVQMYTDSEICDLVSRSEDTTESTDDESSDEDIPVISDGDAARFFGLCLTWLESQAEATVYNTSVLRELQSLAAKKRLDSLKQSKISSYFK